MKYNYSKQKSPMSLSSLKNIRNGYQSIYFKIFISFLLISFLKCIPTSAQITLPHLVSDGMILQRNSSVKIWGWASPKENVQVRFINKTYRTKVSAKGEWFITLPAMNAGGPYTMELKGKNKVTLNDILIGDVWLCSGQSNMEHQMRLHAVRYHDEIEQADYPQIRQFLVPRKTNLNHPEGRLDGGRWIAASPQTVGDFSAVAYFFAKSLYEKYRIPIGLINASVGGSPIQAWMSEESLTAFPDIMKTVNQNKDSAYVNETNRRAEKDNAIPPGEDKGMTGKWYSNDYHSSAGWRTINIPGYWEDQGIKKLDGIVWYRKVVNISQELANDKATLFMGRIVDADEVYINGQKIGNTTYLYPQRRYAIPDGVLKEGDNLIAIRVTNYSGKGGFVPHKPYYIAGKKDTVDLKGYWQYKVGRVFEPLPPNRTQSINLLYQPTALYNAMFAPLENYSIKGFVWYQGESNTYNPTLYGQLQRAMVADWRQRWNNPALPFLNVQLPGFMDMSYLPEESNWAAFREVQRKFLSVPNTGMAVTIDLGEWNDVHPDRKREVGRRLALQAEKIAYHENGVFSGPLYASQEINGNQIEITFTNTGDGLITNDGEAPAVFEIAGADKKYVNAEARIEGDKVIVRSSRITQPLYVRYAWSDFPVNPNLYNKQGLPASPFSTDEGD